MSAERAYFKNAKIELFSFPRFYWQVYGRQDVFHVGIGPKDVSKTYHLKAIEALEGYEMKRSETVVPIRKLKFIGEVAYLNPGNFSGDEKTYRKFIDSAFVAIRMKKSENLIVDLRNNLGGEDAFSDYLVSYFADKPFTWSSRFTLKTSALLKKDTRNKRDTTKAYWQEVLRHRDGEVYTYPFEAYQPQPREKRFGGTLFVLVNRQSYSQAAVTAAQIQDYDFGTIVGEETGEYPSLYASQFQYPLPNTGVPVKVSKGYIIRVNGSRKEEGVIPDIAIRDHLLDEKDEILEGLLQRLDSR